MGIKCTAPVNLGHKSSKLNQELLVKFKRLIFIGVNVGCLLTFKLESVIREDGLLETYLIACSTCA